MEELTLRKTLEEISELIKKYQQKEKKQWGIEVQIAELSKQVGELSKKIIMLEGYYVSERDNDLRYATSKEKIADELWDILFMVVRIANHYEIDLEKEHIKQIEKCNKKF